jgi:hypothetical protein
MTRLSFDQEAWSRGITAMPLAPDVHRDIERARISARAERDGDDFKISTELAAFYFDHFEPPTAAEGPLTVIRDDVCTGPDV